MRVIKEALERGALRARLVFGVSVGGGVQESSLWHEGAAEQA